MFNIAKVGAYITILRKTKKMTQSKLAEILGIRHQAVSNWERGAALPDVTLLLDLAAALGTTVDNLLSAGRDDFKGNEEIMSNIEIEAVNEEQMLEELENKLTEINNF
jgi:transcriptional regulator with XRE-family HTH domain